MLPARSSDAEPIRYRSPQGRWILLAMVLGSGMAGIDATIVNVALPRIGTDLHAGLTSLQWTLNAYTLTLAGLLLIGGSLGDRLGRRRVFLIGVVWFAAASALCGAAPTAGVLVAARALQGVGGALLTPGSLAILQTSFAQEDRSTAVGAWSGLGGVATAIGPILGGALVQLGPSTWRLAFLINIPVAAVIVPLTLRHVPESHDAEATGRIDVAGAALAALGLGGVVYGLTEGPSAGLGGRAGIALAVGVVALLVFGVVEARVSSPMLPLGLFRSRQFSAANVVTFVVYAALGGALFLLPLQLQRVAGFEPVAAGTSLLPVTVVMLLLSARAGRLAQRFGPRPLMTVGPLLVAAGLVLMTRIGAGASYLTDVLPAVLVFALGLAMNVAPLTSTVLAAAPDHQAGIASAVNNDVARAAALLAVAVLPGLAGITTASYRSPAAFSGGFHSGVLIAAALCASGGVLAFATIRRQAAPEPTAAVTIGPAPAEASHCSLSGPPLRAEESEHAGPSVSAPRG